MASHKYSFVPSRTSTTRPQAQATQVLKITAVVAPPLIAVALLAAAGVITSVDRRNEATALVSHLRSAEYVRALLTALQRERGTTCIHLEMIRLRRTTFRNQLENYRNETDNLFAQWILYDDGDTEVNERKEIERMKLYSYRKNADSGNFACNESIKWYNNLNHRLLKSVISRQSVDRIQTTISGFSAYHKILLAKDLIGSVYEFIKIVNANLGSGVTRALGGTYFTHAFMETDAAIQFSEAGGGTAVLLDLIAYEMPAADELFRQLKDEHEELIKQIQITRYTIVSNGANERNIDEKSALLWWEQMTQYIDKMISPIEQFITETLLLRLENQKAAANRRLGLTLLIALLALVLCPTVTALYLLHAQRLQRANRTFDQELHLRMEQINSQKQLSEQLLTTYMPKKVPINTLTWTMHLEARVFAAVTVCSCDIMGFDRLIELATPEQVVRLLNVLHSRLERIASRHDCYKFDHGVDSSAMFVSGLPVVNSSHSEVIARLALDIMELAENFSIPFLIGQTLVIQIGINTGPVCTGVMGNKIPVYTILGKTVQIAKLMEKSAQGMRIHISKGTFDHLSKRHPGEFEYESTEAVYFGGTNRAETGIVPTYNLLACSNEKYRTDSNIAASAADNNRYWKRDYDRTQPCKVDSARGRRRSISREMFKKISV